MKDAATPHGNAAGPRSKGAAEHWSSFARRWSRLGSPVRPHPEDVRRFEAIVAGAAPAAPRALLLGVTPEIAGMRWPAGASVFAVDQAIAVIRGLWRPAEGLAGAGAVSARWQRLPFRDGAFDLVIGDGCLTALGTATAQGAVSQELERVLRPGGLFVQRLFVTPDTREDLAAVFDDLLAGRIGAFDVFKWRLLMATPPRAGHTVCVGDAFEHWATAGIDRDRLAAANGWARERIDTIDDYRDNDALLGFPPLSEALARLAPHFDLSEMFTQPYELAERCPIVLLRRRGA